MPAPFIFGVLAAAATGVVDAMERAVPGKEALKKRFCELLKDHPFNGQSQWVKKILFELLSCAICDDGTYNDEQMEVILHIAEKFEIDDSILEEMQGYIDTILALDKQCEAIIFSERI